MRGKLEPYESEIEMQICHWLRVKGLFFWKQPSAGYFDTQKKRFRKHYNPYVRSGVPDLLVVFKGHLIGLEVKAKAGRQSENQALFQRDLEKAGAHYFLVRSIEDVENCLKGILLHASTY